MQPDGREANGPGELGVSWNECAAAAATYGTPFLLFCPDKAADAFAQLERGLTEWGRARIAYSLKTNPFPPLLRQIRQRGHCIEVVSRWEYEVATKAGFLPSRIVVNGPLKTAEDLRFFADSGTASINIDAVEELLAIAKIADGRTAPVNVGIRVCPPEHLGGQSRFGVEFGSGEFASAVQTVLSHKNLRLRCIHVHLGTQITDVEQYKDTSRFGHKIWQRFGFKNDVVFDIGGGFSFAHDRSLSNQQTDFTSLFAEMKALWGSSRRPVLQIEPGRWIAGPAFVLLTRVLSCKPRSGEPAIVVVDSGTNHNVMAAYYPHTFLLSERSTIALQDFRLCGPLCMEDDVLSGALLGPPPAVGSLIAIPNVGAYSLSLSRSFIQLRPPILQAEGGHIGQLLVARETAQNIYWHDS